LTLTSDTLLDVGVLNLGYINLKFGVTISDQPLLNNLPYLDMQSLTLFDS